MDQILSLKAEPIVFGFATVVELFLNPTTRNLHDFQIKQVRRAIKENKSGICIYDLSIVEDLLALLREKIEVQNQQIFIDPLCELLVLCGKPFVRNTCHAEFQCEEQINSVLAAIASLLEGTYNIVKVSAARALWNFSRVLNSNVKQALDGSRTKNEDQDDQRPSPWVFAQRALLNSGAVSLIVKVLQTEVEYLFSHDENNDGIIDAKEYARAYNWLPGDPNPHSPVFMAELMKVVREVSAYKDSALVLVRNGAMLPMVRVCACLEDFRKEEVKLMLETLWNVLEHSYNRLKNGQIATSRMQLIDKYRTANAFYTLGNNNTLEMMLSLFKTTLKKGHRLADKEIRNEVLIVLSLVARRKENRALFYETGFLSLLLSIGTAAENGVITEYPKSNFTTGHEFDLEMKQLIWYLIFELSYEVPKSLAMVLESNFVTTLLYYLDISNYPLSNLTGAATQTVQKLQISALNILSMMAENNPECLPIESTLDICIRFLNSLQIKFGSKNSFTDGNRDQEIMLLTEATLHLIFTIFSSTNFHADDYGILRVDGNSDANMVLMLLNILDRFNQMEQTPHCLQSGNTQGSSYYNKSNSYPPNVRETAALTLSLLCRHSNFQQRLLREAQGIGVLKECLKIDPSGFHSPETFLAAAIGAIWNGIVQNTRNSLEFVSIDGISSFLSLLECSSPYLRPQCLSCLSDLLQDKRIVPYFFAWRSDKSSRSAAELILDIWIEQENERSNGKIGILDNLERPLYSQDRASEEKEDSNLRNEFVTSSSMRKGNLARLHKALDVARNMMNNSGEDSADINPPDMNDIRGKVYSVLRSLGFDALWKLADKCLEPDQRLVLSVATHYYDFREGEVFADIRDELEIENVVPITSDSIHVKKKVSQCVKLAEKVQAQQEMITKEKEELNQKVEDDFYRNIMNAIQREDHVKQQRKQISNTKRRKEQRKKRQEMLQNSLQEEGFNIPL